MNKSILLVGTESSGLAYISILLERDGYETYKCHKPQLLDQLIAAKRFDLIIIDDQKPALNAVEVCACLKENSIVATTPIILLLPFDKNGANQPPQTVCKQNIVMKPILPHLLTKLAADIFSDNESSLQAQQ